MVLENDSLIQNLDFISYAPGPAAQSGQARAPTQSTLHMGACWGPGQNKLWSLMRDSQEPSSTRKAEALSNSDLRNIPSNTGQLFHVRQHSPTLIFHVYLQMQIWKAASLAIPTSTTLSAA